MRAGKTHLNNRGIDSLHDRTTGTNCGNKNKIQYSVPGKKDCKTRSSS
jgi:hypothetical protein